MLQRNSSVAAHLESDRETREKDRETRERDRETRERDGARSPGAAVLQPICPTRSPSPYMSVRFCVWMREIKRDEKTEV